VTRLVHTALMNAKLVESVCLLGWCENDNVFPDIANQTTSRMFAGSLLGQCDLAFSRVLNATCVF